MDLERAMEFILEQHAKTEAALAQLALTQEATDRRVDRVSRDIARLARLGLRARSRLMDTDAQLKRRADENDKWVAEQKLLMQEIGEKLNALIDHVDRLPGNPAA